MKVAIMQPYLFPYLGYYQLAHCADRFVLYDDVTFIKGGFINRNRILADGRPLRFTLPVRGASQNKLIKELCFSEQTRKVVETIRHAYSKAPFFDDVFPLVEEVLGSEERDIPTVCRRGVSAVFEYLGLHKDILLSSGIDYDRSAPAEDKLIQICRALGSGSYVNSIGGRELYCRESFAAKGCELSFLRMKEVEYDQGGSGFVPNLSIIDVLMHCPKAKARALLASYTLV